MGKAALSLKPGSVKARTNAHPLEIAVIMGDPTLPDSVKKNGQYNAEDFDTIERLKTALAPTGYSFRYLNHHASLITELTQNPPAFVLNLCDEGIHNHAALELHLPALLEWLDIPYSGAGPACLGLCYNKSLVRAAAKEMGITVPEEWVVQPGKPVPALDAFPLLVKPNFGDSSIGITQHAVVHNNAELARYVEHLRATLPPQPMLIQQFLTGVEVSVGVVGNAGSFTRLPILEVDYSHLPNGLPHLLPYESKWLPESPYWTDIAYQQAVLTPAQTETLYNASEQLFTHLGCRDYARFDFRADANGNIKLLEVNPNPGWCWDGKLNLMASLAGLSYTDLLAEIIQAAIARYEFCFDASNLQALTPLTTQCLEKVS